MFRGMRLEPASVERARLLHLLNSAETLRKPTAPWAIYSSVPFLLFVSFSREDHRDEASYS